MSYLDVDALQQESEKMRGSEWIKIGVDTGAGKTARPQSITYGKTILGDSDLTFRTATRELVKGGKRMHVEGCDDWGSNLRVRGVQALVSVGEFTTMGGVTVLYGDKGYRFHKGSNVAKKTDALDPEGVERFSIPRLHSCVQREQRVQHLHETKRKHD